MSCKPLAEGQRWAQLRLPSTEAQLKPDKQLLSRRICSLSALAAEI